MNTLSDLYLSIALDCAAGAGVGFGDVDEAKRSKARTTHVLRNEATLPYEPVHALIVCSTHSFTDGLVLQWEIMGMYEEDLRFWMGVELHPETFAAASCSSVTNKPALPMWSAWIFMDLNTPISTHSCFGSRLEPAVTATRRSRSQEAVGSGRQRAIYSFSWRCSDI